MYPSDYKYTKEHEWVKRDGDIVTIGITDYAQKELGEIVYVELPDVGTSFNKEEVFGSVESVKAVSDIFSPLSGEVESVNEALEDNPELVNSDPHGEGWLISLKFSDSGEFDELMTVEDYTKFIGETGE